MRRSTGIILLSAGALAALLAAMAFSRSLWFAPKSRYIEAATSSSAEAPVSPEAFLPPPPATSTAAAKINAKAAAAGDLAGGEILYGLHPDMRWPVASVTKIMTAEIIRERIDPETLITMAPEDFAGGPSALTANLQPGDQYRAKDLLKVLLLPSSNEAAEAFARSYGRSAFLAAMNAKAASWGLANTHFDDPSGISAANQSTPREFLELVRRVYGLHPEIFGITRSTSVSVQELTTGTFKSFASTNNFAGRPDFLGGKTGTTPEAGDNLVSIFQTPRGPVITLVFGAADRYAATESLLQFIQ